jgi:hypothetical protein
VLHASTYVFLGLNISADNGATASLQIAALQILPFVTAA